MARAFSSASSQYLERSGDPLGSVPFTFSLWFNPDNATANHPLISLESTSYYDWACLLADGASSGDPLTVNVASGGGVSIATQNGFTASSWNHAAGTFDSVFGTYIGSKYSFLNGTKGAVGSGTTSYMRTPIVLRIGRHVNYGYASCKIAEVGIWNVILTDSEIAALAKGYTPQQIRPKSLIAYYPLGGRYGQYDLDRWKNKYDLTAVNSPTWADHGRVIYPRRRVWNVAWSAPAAYTLTCTTATCSGTRRSAGLYCGKKIAAATGTCTGTRNTLTLLASRKIVATVGSCSGSRKSLVLTAQRMLSGTVASGSGSGKTCVLLAARTLAAAHGTCSGTRRDASLLAGRLATCVARSGSGTPQTAGLRCSRYLAVVVRSGGGTANAASLEYSGAAAEFDYSVTAATEAVARRLVTEARSRSVRSEAVARRAATESLCRGARTEALARRLVTEAR